MPDYFLSALDTPFCGSNFRGSLTASLEEEELAEVIGFFSSDLAEADELLPCPVFGFSIFELAFCSIGLSMICPLQ